MYIKIKYMIIKSINPTKGFIRHSKIDLSILPELKNSFNGNRKKNEYKIINHVQVKITSQRYPVFQKSTVCCVCGLQASFFALEMNHKDCSDKYHLNLYGVNEKGEEVLFTKDHIQPKSKGGKNIQSNYQTMCMICNTEKGNNF